MYLCWDEPHMSLLPERHPNLDFFVLDITDAVPKDDLASMEHPLFSLATITDQRPTTVEQPRKRFFGLLKG